MSNTISPEEFANFRAFLEDASGIVLGDNKTYLVTSRLTKIMRESNIATFSQLMGKLKQDYKLRQKIMDAMTTNETSWFRDNYPYDILKEKFLPELASNKATQVKIWSAASSTGQEPYSISMVCSEYLASKPGSIPNDAIQIVGTDISATALSKAKSGIYEGIAAARGLNDERRNRFFRQIEDGWEVVPDIKRRISFKEMNLKQSYTGLGKFDVIFCRNVLIYFSTELKTDIMSRMSQALKSGGYLILGGSESISGYSDDFELVRWKSGVVYQLKKSKKVLFG